MPGRASRTYTIKNGFTLIELLVVITIAGILIGMAVVSFNLIGNDRGLERQVLKLSSLIDLASDEAQIQGRDFGLELMQSGFRFVEYDPFLEVWDEVIGDDVLKSRDLDDSMKLELMLEEHLVLLEEQAKQTQADENDPNRDLAEDYLPHILILASGDITPFRLQVVRLTDQSIIGLQLIAGQDMEVLRDEQELF